MWTPVHRGAPPISRYTRVLRAAHGRVKSTLHSRFGSLQLYMNCGSRYIIVFRLFRVEWDPFFSLSTLNGRAWVFDTDTRSGKNFWASWLPKLSLVLPFASFTIEMASFTIEMFFSLMSWWLHLSVFNLHFEACFACSAQYFLGQSLRSFLRRFRAYLGQSGLTRSRLSVSHTPCTAS